MTEEEWLACSNPFPMLRQLERLENADRRLHRRRFKQSKTPVPPFRHWLLTDRRFRLFTCAVCRSGQITHEWQTSSLDLAERFADGLVSEEEMRAAAKAISDRDPPPELLDPVPFALHLPGAQSSAWNGSHKARLAADPSLLSEPYHEELVATDKDGWLHAALLRDIFGNPFRPIAFDPAWRTSTAVALARQMYDSRDFALMPILGDALEDAGCDSDDILDHCRGPGPHVRGCWVADLVLGKE